MSARVLGIALAAVSFAASACATMAISMRTGPRDFTAADYDRVYDAWTRSDDDFAWGNMDDVLHVTATFESWEFRWAYVVRFAEDHALESPARTEMLRATLDDADENHRFFVTLAGPVFREQNLTSTTSAWRVLLVDPDGRQTVPVEIQRVRRTTAIERVYFPSVSSHRQAFRIVFPARREDGTASIPEGADHFMLRFTGARGRVDLKWELEPPTSE